MWKLVRFWIVGAALPLLVAAVPPLRYTRDDAAMVVRDGATGRTWQMFPAPGEYTWADAQAYCQGLTLQSERWRLPTIKELLTIVDPTSSDPAIDLAIFPSTPAARFWSSTGRVATPDTYWTVRFDFGGSSTHYAGDPASVRCVR